MLCIVLLVLCCSAVSSNENGYFEYNTEENKFIVKKLTGVDALGLSTAAQEAGQTSHSQVGQDEVIIDVLGHKQTGYFIDLAANDWKDLSNSLHLEVKYNWNGICLEPNPQYHKGILQNRRCKLVVNPVSHQTNKIVKFRFDAAYGGIVGKNMDNSAESKEGVVDSLLTTVTLDRVLTLFNAPYDIDYMSLDVEGR